MSYSIGQYRYKGAGSCYGVVPATKKYQTVITDNEATAGLDFKDLSLKVDPPLDPDSDYFLKISIPQDFNYNYSFNVKLFKDEDADSYQFLRQISIPRSGVSKNLYQVVLYEGADGIVRTAIPRVYDSGEKAEAQALYYDSTLKKYYVGLSTGAYQLTTNVNAVSLAASWKIDTSSMIGTGEIIFRPVDSGFNNVVLEMVRTIEDYSIIRGVSGSTEYGRKIPLENFEFTFYKLNDLVREINPGGKLDRIGIRAPAGMGVAVNGEEIRIGTSNVYELSQIPTETLSITAVDEDDAFTIDYQIEK